MAEWLLDLQESPITKFDDSVVVGDFVLTSFGEGKVIQVRGDNVFVVTLSNWILAHGKSPVLFLQKGAISKTSRFGDEKQVADGGKPSGGDKDGGEPRATPAVGECTDPFECVANAFWLTLMAPFSSLSSSSSNPAPAATEGPPALPPLSPEELAVGKQRSAHIRTKIVDVFKVLDLTSKGYLVEEDLKVLFQKLQLSDEDVSFHAKNHMVMMDTIVDDRVTEDEYVRAICKYVVLFEGDARDNEKLDDFFARMEEKEYIRLIHHFDKKYMEITQCDSEEAAEAFAESAAKRGVKTKVQVKVEAEKKKRQEEEEEKKKKEEEAAEGKEDGGKPAAEGKETGQ